MCIQTPKEELLAALRPSHCSYRPDKHYTYPRVLNIAQFSSHLLPNDTVSWHKPQSSRVVSCPRFSYPNHLGQTNLSKHGQYYSATPVASIRRQTDPDVEEHNRVQNGTHVYGNNGSEAVLNGGDGGSDGKSTKYTGGNGGGGSGKPQQPSDDNEGSPSLIWYFNAFFSMLGAITLYIALGKLSASKRESSLDTKLASGVGKNNEEQNMSASSLRNDIQTLKRLQRDVYEQLYHLKQELKSGGEKNSSKEKSRTSWKASLRTAILRGLSREERNGSRLSDVLDFRIRTESWSEDKKLGILAVLSTCNDPFLNGGTWNFSSKIDKIVGTWKVRDGLKLIAPILNGRGDDVVITLNPQAGFGSSDAMAHGSECHQQCRGSGLGAIFSGSHFGFSIAHLLQSVGKDDIGVRENSYAHTSLLQVAGSLNEDIMLGSHVSLRSDSSSSSHGIFEGGESSDAENEGQNSTVRRHQVRLGLTGAWNLNNKRTLSGWTSLPVKSPGDLDSIAAGLTLGTLPIPGHNGWAFTVARSPSKDGNNEESQILAEINLRAYPDEKLLLMPSLIATKRPHSNFHIKAGLQSEWQF